MGEGRKRNLRLNFNRKLKMEFHGTTVTSDAGLLAYRELDEHLGLTSMADEIFKDPRSDRNTQHTIRACMRQSIFSKVGGYEDTNDAERLRVDPAMRQVIGGRAEERKAASVSAMGRFETEILTDERNYRSLSELSGRWIDRVHKRAGLEKLILDLDSSESETYGEQEGSAYNGHFGCTCYHSLFCFNQLGDAEGAMLREGNVHSAHEWRALLEPIIERYRDRDIKKFFRGDGAFGKPGLYRLLEEERYKYAIRLKANNILYKHIKHLLTRPVGRPPKKPQVFYESFYYRAGSWKKRRRVVAKVEWHRGDLFPRVGFIVTNLSWWSKNVVAFYNKRGTAEQWIKEGKNAVKWTKLSCHDFRDNEVRLQLFALAYNLGNFMRRLALPRSVEKWSLTTMREKLIKIGAKVVHHARYITFQMAEVAVPYKLFEQILGKIACLGPTPPVPP